MYSFLGNLIYTYVFSYMFSMLCEAPFLALEKLLLTRD